MKKLIYTLLIILTVSYANAETGAMVFIGIGNTDARLIINEAKEEGALSRLFEQMQVQDSGDETKSTKAVALSNGRFAFECNKTRQTEAPVISCTFSIEGGENTADVNTFISKDGKKKVAMIGMTPVLSKELAGVFPADENGKVDYVLEFSNGVRFEVDGAPNEVFTLGFFQN